MADLKISEFSVATDTVATDILPLIRGSGNSFSNLSISLSTLSANLPQIGNKGITKNVVNTIAPGAIPTNKTIYKLTGGNYTLGPGTSGQTIILLYTGLSTITLAGNNFTTIGGMVSGSTTLLFEDGVWFAITSTLTTFA